MNEELGGQWRIGLVEKALLGHYNGIQKGSSAAKRPPSENCPNWLEVGHFSGKR